MSLHHHLMRRVHRAGSAYIYIYIYIYMYIYIYVYFRRDLDAYRPHICIFLFV